MDIDFVVTWVDMNDPEWQKSFAAHSGKIDNTKNNMTEARFRDYGLLKYWFRGVDKFAPWVRKIHFVTCGQKPDWLNPDHPKLNLVNHEDYIPKQFLPLFNSKVIEYYMHRIPGLSDHFVYFNDDFFITSPLPRERFFHNGLPQDIAAFRINLGLSSWSKSVLMSVKVLNKHFDKKEVQKRDHDKWFHESYGSKARLTKLLKWYGKFVTLRTPHNAQPFLKSTFEHIWEKEGEALTAMSANRFRSSDMYSPELFRTWQICESNFHPYNTYTDTKMFPLVFRTKEAIEAIRTQSYKLVCLNDSEHIKDFEGTMHLLHGAFSSILPEKSSFEL